MEFMSVVTCTCYTNKFYLSDEFFLFEIDNESFLHCLHGLYLFDAGGVDANDVRERGADKVYKTTGEDRDEHMLWREGGRGRERERERERENNIISTSSLDL